MGEGGGGGGERQVMVWRREVSGGEFEEERGEVYRKEEREYSQHKKNV